MQNSYCLRLISLIVAFIMLNFSVYLAEVDALQRVTHTDNLIECIADLMVQSPIEEEEQHSDTTSILDLFWSNTRHQHDVNSFLNVKKNGLHTLPYVKSHSTDTETPPPELPG
jgi:hypothetical protein